MISLKMSKMTKKKYNAEGQNDKSNKHEKL